MHTEIKERVEGKRKGMKQHTIESDREETHTRKYSKIQLLKTSHGSLL